MRGILLRLAGTCSKISMRPTNSIWFNIWEVFKIFRSKLQWTTLQYGVWSLDQHWLVLVLVFGPATRYPNRWLKILKKNPNWNQNWPKIKTGTGTSNQTPARTKPRTDSNPKNPVYLDFNSEFFLIKNSILKVLFWILMYFY